MFETRGLRVPRHFVLQYMCTALQYSTPFCYIQPHHDRSHLNEQATWMSVTVLRTALDMACLDLIQGDSGREVNVLGRDSIGHWHKQFTLTSVWLWMVTDIQLFEYAHTKALKLKQFYNKRSQGAANHNTITAELQLSGLIGTTSHSDMQKIRIIGFFFE